MTVTEKPHLTAFNALPPPEAERRLLRCCCVPRWAHQVAAGRPYRSAGSLYGAAGCALIDRTEEELDQAMAGHPRFGEQAAGEHAEVSRREQAGLRNASAATVTALAQRNAEYEDRFGYVYLVSAEGRDGEELLSVLTQRLGNDSATERAQARTELGKINRIRLRRLIGDVEVCT